MTLSYFRNGANAPVTGITVTTIAALGTFAGTNSQAAFKEVDAVYLKGIYELHLSNNALLTRASRVVFKLQDAGSNNVAPIGIEIQLVAYNPDDANALGLAYLDVATSSRLAAMSYTAPDNTDIASIKAAVEAYLDATISSRLASSSYTAPANADITAIKAQTDSL